VFTGYQRLAVQLVRRLRVGPRHTRVAVVTFAGPEDTRTPFDLDTFRTADEVIAGIW
jgi:hypothetical protein